jgi:hypothetical protein
VLVNWPQAAGPDGNRPVRTANSLNHDILWRTPPPNGGQSGIAVWGDRLFLTTFDDYRDGDPKFSASIKCRGGSVADLKAAPFPVRTAGQQRCQ